MVAWLTVCLCLGTALFGIGLPIGITIPSIFSSIIQVVFQLSPHAITFSQNGDSPVPIYMDIYLWNWTNAEDFVKDKTVVPDFKEIGPFVFRLKSERANVQWNDNHTVTFSPNRTFIFEPSLSLDLDTPVTALSPVPAVLAYFGRIWTSPFFLALINKEVELREEIYKTARARQWIFDGIDDSLLDLIVPLRELLDLPLPFDKFAWFYGRNHSITVEGDFTIFTGTDDLSKLGQLTLWNGKNTTDAYPEACGVIKGYTGEILAPLSTPPKALSVFSADICSDVLLEWAGEEEAEEGGVNGWKFVGSPMTFDNGSLYPETACYCNGECVPYGARNVSACKFGAPAFVSFPHFYLAHESFYDGITGMTPNDSHQFFLKMEPTTGIPLSVAAQLQINLMVRPSPSLSLYKDMPPLYFPMLWFKQHAAITPDLSNLLNILLSFPTIGMAFFFVLMAIGMVLFGVGLYFTLRSNEGYNLS